MNDTTSVPDNPNGINIYDFLLDPRILGKLRNCDKIPKDRDEFKVFVKSVTDGYVSDKIIHEVWCQIYSNGSTVEPVLEKGHCKTDVLSFTDKSRHFSKALKLRPRKGFNYKGPEKKTSSDQIDKKEGDLQPNLSKSKINSVNGDEHTSESVTNSVLQRDWNVLQNNEFLVPKSIDTQSIRDIKNELASVNTSIRSDCSDEEEGNMLDPSSDCEIINVVNISKNSAESNTTTAEWGSDSDSDVVNLLESGTESNTATSEWNSDSDDSIVILDTVYVQKPALEKRENVCRIHGKTGASKPLNSNGLTYNTNEMSFRKSEDKTFSSVDKYSKRIKKRFKDKRECKQIYTQVKRLQCYLKSMLLNFQSQSQKNSIREESVPLTSSMFSARNLNSNWKVYDSVARNENQNSDVEEISDTLTVGDQNNDVGVQKRKKFHWRKVILETLKSQPGKKIDIEKFRRMVMAKYFMHRGSISCNTSNKFVQYLHTTAGVNVGKNIAFYSLKQRKLNASTLAEEESVSTTKTVVRTTKKYNKT